jgi:simple sugar transport system ATP-binding protein
MTQEISEKYNLPINPEKRVMDLSVGYKQRVEILKILLRGAKILLLDEPTAVLTPQETEELFVQLKNLKNQGFTIVFISHKLNEIKEICDRITVLRDGQVVGAADVDQVTERDIARMMVGRDVLMDIDNGAADPKETLLRVRNLNYINMYGKKVLKDISFDLRSGEIVGIAGVAGNGQKELTEVITGLRKKTGGKVVLCETDITKKPAGEIEKMGVAFVPEDRHGMGLVPGLSAVDNVMLRDYDTAESSRRGIVDTQKVAQRTEELIRNYEIKCAGIQRPVRLMSGGNMQKLLLAREISGSPKLLITCYPVRGLDIGATNAVHKMLEDQRKNGVAVLLIAEDLEELFQLSDRIAVLHKGRITGIVERKDFNYDTVGHLMVGSAREEDVQNA